MDRKNEGYGKKSHPKLTAGFLSRIFFCWMIPTFVKGYRKPLNENDLFGDMDEHDSTLLGDKLKIAWDCEIRNKQFPSLWNALWKVFWKELVLSGFWFLIIEFVTRLGQPLCISQIMGYYTPNQIKVSRKDLYLYAGLLVFLSFFQILLSHYNSLLLQHLGMKMRIATSSVIFGKALRLSKFTLMDITIGKMVNLLSNDVNRFDSSMNNIHYLWAAPVETGIVLYLLYTQLGLCAITGVGFLLLYIPIQLYISKQVAIYRFGTALRTDERLRLMNEIINGIQIIKMFTWEKPFTKLIESARQSELSVIKNSSFIIAITFSFILFITRFAIYLSISTFVFMGNTPTHEFVFICTSYYGLLRQSVTMFLPSAVRQVTECNVSVKRIQKFLLREEINSTNITSVSNLPSTGIYLQNASAKWDPTSEDTDLTDINLKLSSKQLIGIIGSVGSGKSTLLNVLLKELPLMSGQIQVKGTISYCSQEPWLFSGSVRQNILFGQQYKEKKYNEVIRVCCLETDLSLFPYADKTIVGEKGLLLSGGQRARISLARAIYRDADIYLLDDPLSAVDSHVGKKLFQDCILNYLQEKCVVLVTHQLQYLQKVESVNLMDNGRIITTCTFQEFKDSLNKNGNEERPLQQTFNKNNMINNGEPTELKEQMASGKLPKSVYIKYLRSGGGLCKAFFVILLFLAAQIIASGLDYFITFWVNIEQDKQENSGNHWTSNFFTTKNNLYIYTILAWSLVVITIFRSLAFYNFSSVSSKKLHNDMFNSIVYAPMKFFNTNPSGRILNRLSKDIGCMDEQLPQTMIDSLQIALNVTSICLMVGLVNPFVFVPTLIILLIFYLMRIVFLATSVNIKRMEATTRSPIISHLSSSVQGITTIRAFGVEDILQKEFDKHQNLHSSAFYMYLAANRTFGFWLDFHCVVYIGLITIGFLFIKDENYGGNIGLAITQSLSLCGVFQWGMRQWSELENQMTSIERILEYSELETESGVTQLKASKDWPKRGNIKFKSVNMRYSINEPFVLKNINFEVKSGEKLGIVGRTGAGKSSLISALFRLTEIEGNIYIDNVDISKISLDSLRSKISIIPQEPVLFSGTLRKNLDPFNEYHNDVLWDALKKVELKNVVLDLPSGLDSVMKEGASNLSVGQRQLVCLARAIIRENKILVMDEATANVDSQTDSCIQTTIRTKFADCTVITIAHRLHSIMDSDKVLVMDAGCAVEFGHPYKLIKKNGVFTVLVKETGGDMEASLIAIAKKSFMAKKNS